MKACVAELDTLMEEEYYPEDPNLTEKQFLDMLNSPQRNENGLTFREWLPSLYWLMDRDFTEVVFSMWKRNVDPNEYDIEVIDRFYDDTPIG